MQFGVLNLYIGTCIHFQFHFREEKGVITGKEMEKKKPLGINSALFLP
jgi:hypothetical protein